jgi:hypothetical protein
MTPERRTLRYESLDQVMPDVERLLEGHTTVGTWSLAQICRHLANAMRRLVDLPASTPYDPSFPAQDPCHMGRKITGEQFEGRAVLRK